MNSPIGETVARESLKFFEAYSEAEIAAIESLANTIWHEHFTPIIGQAQVGYMLEKFQNKQAIRQQMDSGYIYILAQQNDENIGYAGIHPDKTNHALQLSKFYLLKEKRGQGLGQQFMDYIEAICHQQHIDRIWLTVNRHNTGPIAAYKRMGFIITQEIVQDIGDGYVMDDFIMEKKLSSPA